MGQPFVDTNKPTVVIDNIIRADINKLFYEERKVAQEEAERIEEERKAKKKRGGANNSTLQIPGGMNKTVS